MESIDAVSSVKDIESSNVSYKSEISGSSHFHESHSFLKSQVPFTAVDSGQSRSCLVLDAHSPKTNKQTKQCLHCSTNERTQEQENQLNDSSTTERLSDEHILIQPSNSFLMLSVTKLTDAHYRKLAELMNSVCDDLATNIPDYSDKFNEIKQMVESTIQIYNNQSEGLTEQANKDVQLQYKKLTDMLESLPLPQPLLNIDIDEILKDMQFQECVGPYSPDKLVKAVKRINRPRPTVSSQSKCSIQ